MNCTYHSDREAVGVCVDCGRFICDECKVVLDNKLHCNPCIDKPSIQTVVPLQTKRPSWFARHLNWTFALAYIALYPIMFLTGFSIASYNPYISYDALMAIGMIIQFIFLALVGGWVLKQKDRSLWYLMILIGLYAPLFIGLIFLAVFLSIQNRRLKEVF